MRASVILLLSGYVRNVAMTESDIAAGVFDVADGPDDEFVFGLDRILDGIEHLVQANQMPHPGV